MHVMLVDLDRNVRTAPTKIPGKDLIGAMRSLAIGHAVNTGRLEFEVDQTFLDALLKQDADEAKATSNPPQVIIMTDVLARPSLDDIPIQVAPWLKANG